MVSQASSPQCYEALDERVTALLPALKVAVSTESWRWFEEFVRAGGYGLAEETAAEGLLDVAAPPALCRDDVLSAAGVMALETEPISRLRDRMASES